MTLGILPDNIERKKEASSMLGGFLRNGGETANSVKRKLKEMMAPTESNALCDVLIKEKPPFTFYNEDLLTGRPNHLMRLIFRAMIVNFGVHRVLVHQGASHDIIFSNLFRTLGLSEDDLTTHGGCDLTCFNGSTNEPWGLATLRVTFGENKAKMSFKCQFLIIDCPSPYNCIIGWTTLAELGVVSSMVHLKMRYHNDQDEVVFVLGDVEANKECYLVGFNELKDRRERGRGERLH